MRNDDADISQVDPDSRMDIVRTHLRARYAGQVDTTDDTAPADDAPEESAALDGALHEAIERALAESVDGVLRT